MLVDQDRRVTTAYAELAAGRATGRVTPAVTQELRLLPGPGADTSGGAHCLRYGSTTDPVRVLTFVTAAGEVVRMGGASAEAVGPALHPPRSPGDSPHRPRGPAVLE